MTPVGAIFWFGFGVLMVLASLWLDRFLPMSLGLPSPVNIFSATPVLIMGATPSLWALYRFIKARGTPVPFNPPPRLVTGGIYSRVRNPMVLGWIIMLIGVGLLLNSISLIFILTPLFMLLNFVYLKTIEEKEMEKKFGEEYLKYKQNVPMFFPRLGSK
ncbi:MAG: isoprenylcysteine carboxylmethyltransferase family protein [Dehalococcoidia bacterium]|nr:MAG: isoprenylcysteine carboxylmethyltransferase family protein [Dehalococcoidia bacterium]